MADILFRVISAAYLLLLTSVVVTCSADQHNYVLYKTCKGVQDVPRDPLFSMWLFPEKSGNVSPRAPWSGPYRSTYKESALKIITRQYFWASALMLIRIIIPKRGLELKVVERRTGDQGLRHGITIMLPLNLFGTIELVV